MQIVRRRVLGEEKAERLLGDDDDDDDGMDSVNRTGSLDSKMHEFGVWTFPSCLCPDQAPYR